MRMEIREKLKKIAELYPEEILAKRKERWRRMWAGEAPLDRYPFLMYPIGVDYYNTVYTKEDRLNVMLDEFINRAFLEEDFIPAFFPGCRQATIPCMLGAQEVISNGDYTCSRTLSKLEDIDSMPEPRIIPGTPAWDWLELEKYFIDECDGQIPIHVCDMQGPLDVFSQIFGYDNVFCCAFDDEKRYDHAMNRITEAFKLLWDSQKKLCGELFIPTHMYGWTWVPENIGASLSADCMPMLSPDFFEAFYVPYLRKLGQYYGKITVHSCGNFSAVVPVLTEIPEVWAVNASQMTPQMLHKAGWNKDKVIVTKEDFTAAEDIFTYIKENSLRVELAIRELWTTEPAKGLALDPASWHDADREKIKERNRQLVAWTTF